MQVSAKRLIDERVLGLLGGEHHTRSWPFGVECVFISVLVVFKHTLGVVDCLLLWRLIRLLAVYCRLELLFCYCLNHRLFVIIQSVARLKFVKLVDRVHDLAYALRDLNPLLIVNGVWRSLRVIKAFSHRVFCIFFECDLEKTVILTTLSSFMTDAKACQSA